MSEKGFCSLVYNMHTWGKVQNWKYVIAKDWRKFEEYCKNFFFFKLLVLRYK